jgi:predicted transcriptional regulator
MANELVPISPEGVEVANAYITLGNVKGVCEILNISREQVQHWLNTREVKKYIDTAYLDTGYRNRNNIASLLDEMIESKLEEAQESGVYSKKDLAELLSLAHKMRMDEIKAQQSEGSINVKNQQNIQINEGMPFGAGNYGKLIQTLLQENE